jgi:hypothetical protein
VAIYRYLLLSLLAFLELITYSSVCALQQMAGPVVIKVGPGETQKFGWSLFSDKDHTEIIRISAIGDGAQFLSFPKRVNLTANEVLNVPVTVSVPSNYSGGSTLTPKIRASEFGENSTNGGSTINIEMAKVVSLIVRSQNK